MRYLAIMLSIFVGSVGGVVFLGTVGWLLPSSFANLGLHGTLLSMVGSSILAVGWLRSYFEPTSTGKRSLGSLLIQGFAISLGLRGLFELAVAVFGAPTPEQMTWGGKVVVEGGAMTAAGWILLIRGHVESGVAGTLFCATTALVAAIVRGVTGRSASPGK
ncbi:MAG: hypothetical protein ACK59M_13020 [Pseudomonadota bacterium]|jgi:hypothetical protein